MKKFTITDLAQAEDRQIDIAATIDGSDLIDVAAALFVLRDNDGTELIRYTLGSGVLFSNSTFSILLTDTDTSALVGKYQFELWFKDSLDADTLAAHGTMKFNPTFGRFA